MLAKDDVVYTIRMPGEKVTVIQAHEALIEERGALIFRSLDYGIVAAFIPNEWLSFTAKVPDKPSTFVVVAKGSGVGSSGGGGGLAA